MMLAPSGLRWRIQLDGLTRPHGDLQRRDERLRRLDDRCSRARGEQVEVLDLTAGGRTRSVAPAPSALASGSAFIVFNHGDGVVVRNRTQADQRLKGTSRSFRAAMGSWGHRDDLALQRNCGVRGGIVVQGYLNNRWGMVGGSDCGVIGGVAIFKHKSVGWRKVIVTQEFWDCGQLRRNHVALRILSVRPMRYDATHNCYNYAANHPGSYVP